MMKQFSLFSRNGEILPSQEATIPLNNIAYSYGFGVYETIKVRKGISYFVKQHIDRLCYSAEMITLQHPFRKKVITQYLADLVNALHLSEEQASCNIKLLLIGGKEPLLFIQALPPLYPDRKLYSHGAKTMTVHYERLFPNAKTLNMLGSYLAYTKARDAGCYDGLLIDREGNVIEGTRTNFFAIKGDTLYSAPLEKILEGVTRVTVLAVAKKLSFTLNETAVPFAKIGEYDGAFLTSTSSKIIPIKQIDDFLFPSIPEKLKELMKAYDAFLDNSKGMFTPLSGSPVID